ncbi:MAG: cell division protein ZapA [Rhabdaerophilum sp.]
MAQVSVTIDGKQFRMACEDGQESHLETLAADVDARIKSMRQSFGEIGDLRLAVMAGLMLADEAREERRKSASASEAITVREAALSDASRSGSARELEIAGAITSLAERVDRIARALTSEERDAS